MKIDMKKFATRESRGIFSDSTFPESAYKEYSQHREEFIGMLRALIDKHRWSSAIHSPIEEPRIKKYVDTDPEVSIHTLISDMTHNGSSWQHLSLLYYLFDIKPAHVNQGRFYRQIIEVLTRYEDLVDASQMQ